MISWSEIRNFNCLNYSYCIKMIWYWYNSNALWEGDTWNADKLMHIIKDENQTYFDLSQLPRHSFLQFLQNVQHWLQCWRKITCSSTFNEHKYRNIKRGVNWGIWLLYTLRETLWVITSKLLQFFCCCCYC